MADEFEETDNLQEPSGTDPLLNDEVVDTPQPVVPATPQVSQEFSELQHRMAMADLQSRELLNQMILSDRNRQAAPSPAGPAIPADILEGARPIIDAVLGERLKEIDGLKATLGNLIAKNQGQEEKSFILSQVPEWETVKMDVAKHIHSQLDTLGVPQDPEIRRQYFNPASVVSVAALLKAQRGIQAPASESLATRSVVEGRGGGTTPTTVPSAPDYTTMSDAEFAKREAQISAARMRRNSG